MTVGAWMVLTTAKRGNPFAGPCACSGLLDFVDTFRRLRTLLRRSSRVAVSEGGKLSRTKKPRVALDELADPDLNKRAFLVLHVPPAQQTDEQGAQDIDDQVPHRVG